MPFAPTTSNSQRHSGKRPFYADDLGDASLVFKNASRPGGVVLFLTVSRTILAPSP